MKATKSVILVTVIETPGKIDRPSPRSPACSSVSISQGRYCMKMRLSLLISGLHRTTFLAHIQIQLPSLFRYLHRRRSRKIHQQRLGLCAVVIKSRHTVRHDISPRPKLLKALRFILFSNTDFLHQPAPAITPENTQRTHAKYAHTRRPTSQSTSPRAHTNHSSWNRFIERGGVSGQNVCSSTNDVWQRKTLIVYTGINDGLRKIHLPCLMIPKKYEKKYYAV